MSVKGVRVCRLQRIVAGLLLSLFLALLGGVSSPVWAVNTDPYGVEDPSVPSMGTSLVIRCGQLGTDTPIDSCSSFEFTFQYPQDASYSSRFLLLKADPRGCAGWPSPTYGCITEAAKGPVLGASQATNTAGGTRVQNIAVTSSGYRWGLEFKYTSTTASTVSPVHALVDMTSEEPGATPSPTPTAPGGTTTVDTCGDTKAEPCFSTVASDDQSFAVLVVLGALGLLLLSGILASQLRRS